MPHTACTLYPFIPIFLLDTFILFFITTHNNPYSESHQFLQLILDNRVRPIGHLAEGGETFSWRFTTNNKVSTQALIMVTK